MVGHQTLNLAIGVRVPASQPFIPSTPDPTPQATRLPTKDFGIREAFRVEWTGNCGLSHTETRNFSQVAANGRLSY